MSEQMIRFLELLITLIISVLGSGGLFTWLQSLKARNSYEDKLLMALAHDRIIFLAKRALKEGSITIAEYETLHLLFKPYEAMGGNGSAKKMMALTQNLPIREDHSLRLDPDRHIIKDERSITAAQLNRIETDND